jgi:hypothetical protein
MVFRHEKSPRRGVSLKKILKGYDFIGGGDIENFLHLNIYKYERQENSEQRNKQEDYVSVR